VPIFPHFLIISLFDMLVLVLANKILFSISNISVFILFNFKKDFKKPENLKEDNSITENFK
jgi:hypothetical protein